jgi:hypothetical protein
VEKSIDSCTSLQDRCAIQEKEETKVNFRKGFVWVFPGPFQGHHSAALSGRTARVKTKMVVFTFSQTFSQKNTFLQKSLANMYENNKNFAKYFAKNHGPCKKLSPK